MKAALRRLPPALALLLAVLPSGALEVSSVASGTVSLDGVLVVRGMTLVEADGEAWVVMPASGGRGDDFADVRLRSRALHDRLAASLRSASVADVLGDAVLTNPPAAALAGGAVPVRRSRRPSFAVERVQSLHSSMRLANVLVVFDGEIEAVFGVLARSDGSLSVLPPAAKNGSVWEPLFEIREPALKADVEAAVLAAFKERR